MLTLSINGKETTVEVIASVAELLNVLGYASEKDRKVAVAINGTFAPRSQWNETTVSDGDKLDIVAPVQGG